jgi:hypothetical protein
LPEEHLAYFVLEVVAELDLSDFYAVHDAKDTRGPAGFHPAMLVAVLAASPPHERSSRSWRSATTC